MCLTAKLHTKVLRDNNDLRHLIICDELLNEMDNSVRKASDGVLGGFRMAYGVFLLGVCRRVLVSLSTTRAAKFIKFNFWAAMELKSEERVQSVSDVLVLVANPF